MLTVLSLVLVSGVLAAGGQTGPKLIYPPSDPAKDIAAAQAAAKQDGKFVLIDFGADWCPDCRVLGALLDDASVAPFVRANFHVVHVDVGRRDRNAGVVAEYHATSDAWIPAIVVLDSQGRTVAVTDDTRRITRRDTPETLLSLLKVWAPKQEVRELSAFTEHGVRVTLALERDSSGQAWLAGRFAPVDPDTHLYAQELPADGVDGLGRPTRLEVTSTAGLRPTAGAVADRPVQSDRIDALKLSLPVYPAGAVTLRMPVTVPAGAGGLTEVSVRYMACGASGCLAPVERRITVR